MNAAASSATTGFIVRIWAMVGLACVALVCGSFYLHQSLHRMAERREPAPPALWTTSAGFTATERNGRQLHWGDLRGKVVVCASLYTVCPHGCAAVIAGMQDLRREFGAREDFHLVSIALAPERDTPSSLGSYAQALGLKPEDHWWFLTGERVRLWSFLTDDLKLRRPELIPEDQRLNPLDYYEHDLRIVLLDRAGRVRGQYEVTHPEPEIASLMRGKLERDVRRLLDDPRL